MQNESNPKEQKDALTLGMQNNPCNTCRAFGTPPPCKGHGGKGGGKGGGKTNDRIPSGKEIPVNLSTSIPDNAIASTYTILRGEKNLAAEWSQLLKTGNSVQFETGLLMLENDSLRGILNLRPKPGLSKEEAELVKNVLKTIKAEFDEFKEELQEKGISTTQFTAVIKDNELSIKIPNPKYFAEFMQRLADKNLLPYPAIHEERETLSQTSDKKKYPSPFDISKGPKPPKPNGWGDDR